jgi:hypothetical protein
MAINFIAVSGKKVLTRVRFACGSCRAGRYRAE